MYIAITGNIGCGKTTLTEILSSRLGITPYYETNDNPYIGDFYDDMSRWSFNLQVYFLASRIMQVSDILRSNSDLVQDRTVYEDAYIFAENLHDMGLMATRDYETYMKIFSMSSEVIPHPDVMIYIKASVPTLINQIQKRGRAYEMSIQEGYLERLNTKYEQWIGSVYKGKVITIDADRDDFMANPQVLEPIIKQLMVMK